MPSSSIASLSKLASLTGPSRRNQFFDPTGEDADGRDREDALDADAEARTGLNPAGRRELGLAQMADSLDALDFAKHQRRETERRQDAAWLGPEGWARTSPESAQHAQDLAFGDARVAHEAANQPTMLRMEREKTLSAGRDKSDAYWQPGNQSMLDNEARRTEDLNRTRYVDPVIARGESAEDVAHINAGARTGAATITANGRSADASNRGSIDLLRSLLDRADVNPTDPESLTKMLSGLGAVGARPGTGGAATQGPDLSGLAPGHGRTFSSGPYQGQTWTVDASGTPSRVK